MDYLKKLESWRRLGIQTHEELAGLVEAHHGHVGSALFSRAAIGSRFVILVMVYLRSQGIPVVEFNPDPEKRVRLVVVKSADSDFFRTLRSEIAGGRSWEEIVAIVRDPSLLVAEAN